MSYKIIKGIPESELKAWLAKAYKKYGYYNKKYVNYTNAEVAPIVMCTVVCEDEILLVKRGYGLADAEGYWSTVNGFIDEIKPVLKIAQQELKEELGLNADKSQIKVAKSYTLKNPKEKRSYIVFPCLIKLNAKPNIKLDREHTDFAWIKRRELESYEILDDLVCAVDSALAIQKF
jgi:8-oxo-dGTP pyrophosphatase MutT (NUDIX family)